MKKHHYLFLFISLLFSSLVEGNDNENLYSLSEKVEIETPKIFDHEKDCWLASWYGKRERFVCSDRYTETIMRACDGLLTDSRHLFNSSSLEVSDLLPIYLKGKPYQEEDIEILKMLDNGMIIRIVSYDEGSYEYGGYTYDSLIETTRLVRLILSDHSYHTIAYESYRYPTYDWSWTAEEEQAWVTSLEKATVVPISQS